MKSKENLIPAKRTNPDSNYAYAQEMEEDSVQQVENCLEDATLLTLQKAGAAYKDRIARKRELHKPHQEGSLYRNTLEPREKETVVREPSKTNPQGTSKQEQQRCTAQKQIEQQVKKVAREIRGVDTPEEMRETYHFTDRQNEYLTLLSGEDTAILWGKLLGGLIQGSDELMAPGMDTVFADGALQWPLPVAGTITSPQGYRTDPLTGKTSYHSGTDIAVPEGTPILAAADGTVTVANALDSWGGSYGYYVKIDHGGGLTTLYAHCSRICVTVGQEVKAGQVIAYVGHTGRATGAHLHFEMRNYD